MEQGQERQTVPQVRQKRRMLGRLLKCRVPLQPLVKLAGEAVELHTVLPIQTLSSSLPEASVLPNCPSVPVRMSNAEKIDPIPKIQSSGRLPITMKAKIINPRLAQ